MMNKFRNLATKIALVTVAAVGMGIAAQPARACIAPVYDSDGNYAGHISCGSSAGNYMYVDGEFIDGPSVDLLCLLGAC